MPKKELAIKDYSYYTLKDLLPATNHSDFFLKSFIWTGVNRSSDLDDVHPDRVKSNNKVLRQYRRYYGELKSKHDRLKEILQTFNEKDDTPVWEAEVKTMVEEVEAIYQIQNGRLMHLAKFIFSRFESKVSNAKLYEFETTHKSYEHVLKELQDKLIHKPPTTQPERKILEQRITIAKMKVEMFDFWNSIETNKKILVDLEQIKKDRNRVIWVDVFAEVVPFNIPQVHDHENAVKIFNIGNYFDVPIICAPNAIQLTQQMK